MACKKIAYPSEATAEKARLAIKAKKERYLRVYKCSTCGKWHLGNTKGTRVANLSSIFRRLGY